ncbi:MarR family winged helix-turn-helix transcriptional regulator [Pseudonocardia spinosispora]|uniref:MarR family winged helix-turn-helix transcriptional regulator n=1 Tax=Pseudonocardia spinosispora TaxID=103441 RepID=UPI0004278110|nr:MarR family transcriptional regulator [Pseudonocardia spinosispora]
MQELASDTDPEVAALEMLTRVLVGLAWNSAHAAPSGLSFSQFRLLLVLHHLGRVPSSRLAAALGVNASTVTRLADKLVTSGYLERGADERNRAVVTVEVTETGRTVVAQVLAVRQIALRDALDRMPEQTRASVVDGARQFCATAADVPALHWTGPGPL